jgi:hypothetical protein
LLRKNLFLRASCERKSGGFATRVGAPAMCMTWPRDMIVIALVTVAARSAFELIDDETGDVDR